MQNQEIETDLVHFDKYLSQRLMVSHLTISLVLPSHLGNSSMLNWFVLKNCLLFQKFKLLENIEFNHLSIILTDTS